MTVTINGSTGITSPEVTLDNTNADGGQVVLKSSGYSNWNIDNYSGDLRNYYGSTVYTTLTSSGNFGIGTSSPANNGAGTTALTINSTTDSRTEYWVNGSALGKIYANTDFNLWMTGSGAMRFQTSGTERMRIDSNGSLLLNSTGATSYKFMVSSDSAGSYYPAAFNNTNTGSNSQVVIDILRNSSRTGYITNTNNSTSFTSTSDYRLKKDVQPMQNALIKISALKPVTYKWKSDGSDGQGFIAHELAEIFPDAVHGEKDAVNEDGSIKPQGVDTSFLVATLTAAIQEQQAIISDLKARIETLENK